MTIKRKILKPENNQKPPKKNRWLSILVLAFFISVGGIGGWLAYISMDLPTFEQLEHYTPELTSKVYSADGHLIKEFYTKKRFYVSLNQVPEDMIAAVLSIEDHLFFEHWGISPIRFIKVVVKFLITRDRQQGASTITQQLARRLYLTPEKTVVRKVKEVLTSIQLERTYTKPEILEMYLNQMQFGHGTYGIVSAARNFFGRDLPDLTIAEYALLAGMAQRPGALNPYRYYDRAIKRRNLVLLRMLQESVITLEEYEKSIQEPINLIMHEEQEDDSIAPYFVEDVRRKLYDKYGMGIYEDGMKIYTTLDTRVQACAESAIVKQLPKLQAVVDRNMRKKNNFKKLVPPSMIEEFGLPRLMANEAFVDSLINEKCRVQVATVVIDPTNGHVLAMVGGRNFNESEFNRATQAIRQPGSIFKPLVYASAVDNGYMPYYQKLNQPIVTLMPDGTRWTPNNYDKSVGGKTTLREALRLSLNRVTARLVQEDIPPSVIVKYAHSLGISTHLDAVDALALGSCGVYPIEIVSAFGVFANNGVLVNPNLLYKIEDKHGNVIEKTMPQSKGVLREETNYIIVDMLKTVASRGTGASARSVYKFYREAGGKTGTTNDFTDAWYVSFTPQLVTGTWVGLDDPSLSLGNRQSGARAALPITAMIMEAAHDTLMLPEAHFVRPDGIVEVTVCPETQSIATEFCPDAVQDICTREYMPKETCTVHTGEKTKSTNRQRRNIRL